MVTNVTGICDPIQQEHACMLANRTCMLAIEYCQLCTLEFDIRRPSYYWLLVALGQYQPYVWEYSRLNISNNVMSKRKVPVKLANEMPIYVVHKIT